MRRRTFLTLAASVASGVADTGGTGRVLDPDGFRHYIDDFNSTFREGVVNLIPDARAWDWLKANIPFFTCPAKNIGICCNDISDTAPAIELPQYLNLARSIEPQDRTHVFTLSWSVQSPFGKGRRWMNGGIGARVLGGWQMNALTSMYSGKPFNVTGSTTPLNSNGIGTQRPDLVSPEVAILGAVGPGQKYFDRRVHLPPVPRHRADPPTGPRRIVQRDEHTALLLPQRQHHQLRLRDHHLDCQQPQRRRGLPHLPLRRQADVLKHAALEAIRQ